MATNSVLTFCDYYIPGFKAGGPIKSVTSIVEILGDEFSFHVITSARDLGSPFHYPNVALREWVSVGKAQVFYTPSGRLAWKELKALLAGDWASIYLNSFFSPNTILTLLALRVMGKKVPVLLAPRGEFSPGALQLKRLKKMIFLAFVKRVGLYAAVYWHASTLREQAEIGAHFPLHAGRPSGRGEFFVAGNLSTQQPNAVGRTLDKAPGSLRVAFLSRVARKKNLHYAIEVLGKLDGRIEFDVWGPLEDESYWQECQALIDRSPADLKISHMGAIESSEVVPKLGEYHLFLFPTLGENFGHAILEALTAGCAILISDTTPWRGLQEKGCGWDLPLSEPGAFVAALTEAVNWDAAKFAEVSAAARATAEAYLVQPENLAANRHMFATVCGQSGS